MRTSRMVRALSGLVVGTVLLGASGCSTVQDLIPFGGDSRWWRPARSSVP